MLTYLFKNINHTANLVITGFGKNLPRVIINNLVEGNIPHSKVRAFGPFNQKQKRVIHDTRVEARNYYNISFNYYNEELNAELIEDPIDFLVVPGDTISNLKEVIKTNISLLGRQRFILIHKDKSEHKELFDWVKNIPVLNHSKVYSSDNFAYIKVKTNNQLKPDVIKDPNHLWI